MSQSDRFHVIDYIRGLAIFIVILTHVLSEYRFQSELFFFLWDIFHFAVPIFVFCSAFIFFEKNVSFEKLQVNKFIWNRLKRLLIPYYLFLLIYLIVSSIVTGKFPSQKQVLENIFLTGGVDINWLVLLFIQLMFVMLFILFFQKNKKLLYLLTAVSILFSFVFLFFRAGFGARYLHWISWSSMVFFTYFFVRKLQRQDYMRLSLIVFGSIFIVLLLLKPYLGYPSGFFANKYPPNIFYLSYGILMLSFWHLVFNHFLKDKMPIARLLTFFSQNSYQLYFIHYILLYILSHFISITGISWYFLFAVIITASSVITWILKCLEPSILKPITKV